MGIKGDKLTSDSENSQLFLIDQLKAIKGITSKKMFGGFGIFHEVKMFGIVNSKGKIYFKADETMCQKYKDLGSEKHSRMPYYAVPEKILDDDKLIITWANESITISK